MSSLSYSTPRLAVRDSFDDEDVSDDVEDEVFIRDGRNGFKVDEERGVKRPLMAPRRKVKSNQFHSETCKSTSCKMLCLPCCYGIIALSSLLGLMMLVVFLVLWFPLPLEQIAFWRVSESATPTLIPCTELVTQYVWTRSLPKLTSESALQVNDVNKDGVLDIIIAYGTGHDVPDFVCTLYFNGVTPCLGGLLALDGLSGRTVWQHWAPHAVYKVDCGTDVTGDHVKDCLASGKGGILRVVNGNDGTLVWQLESRQEELQVDIYAAQFIHDVDGDGIQDVLAAHTEDTAGAETGPAVCGHLVLLSGRDGKLLQRVSTPGGEETYYAPQLLVHTDGELLVLFGTGGPAAAGGLYVVPLQQLTLGDLLQVKTLYKDPFKGVMSPPALADVNLDGSEDIVVATFNSSVLAFDGRTFQLLWNYTFPSSETFSVPTPGYFNDDNVPDFLVKYQTGPGSPVYYYSQTAVLDGRTGALLLDKILVDTSSSQMGGLSISIEDLGNDLFLHWQADCIGREGATEPFAFLPGDSLQVQNRADLCKLRFNSTLATNLLALSEHLPPPGVSIYSSELHKDVEFDGVVNSSLEVQRYLSEHPDFRETYQQKKASHQQFLPDKKEFNVEIVKDASSNFRHKQDPDADQPGFYYGEDYLVPNRGRNRNTFSGVGEGEEVLPVFPNGNKYPDVRKHGQWRGFEGRDPDYDVLYDPSSDEQTQRDERRKKREASIMAIQRLTSAGVLAPSLSNVNNDSIDVIFATYWVPPADDVHIIQGKDLDCLKTTKHTGVECPEVKRKPKASTNIINMGQMTVYRLKLLCQCRDLLPSEKCSIILPYIEQSWPTATGVGANGYFRGRN